MHEIIASALPNFRRGIAEEESAILPFYPPKKISAAKNCACFAEDETARARDASERSVRSVVQM
jgi:hypothetical protein